MEILIVVCLAVLVSVFIVKFCIKGESEDRKKTPAHCITVKNRGYSRENRKES